MHDYTGMYCCLQEPERAALDVITVQFLAELNAPIPSAFWDAIWSGAGMAGHPRQLAALETMSLEVTIIVIPDELPVPALAIVDLLSWLEWEAWWLTAASDCVDGCPREVYW